MRTHTAGIIARNRTTLLLLAAVTTCVLLVAMVPRADSATGRAGVKVSGNGVKKAGREVRATVYYTNTNSNAGIAPERVNQILVSSRTLKWNSRARGVPRCGAAIPNDGRAPRCSSRSKVGSGSITGIFGQPLQSATLLGVLSPVNATVTLYNYKPASGNQARLLAVVRTRTPLAGVSINVLVPVSRGGTLTINVPDVAQMPPAIPAALPPGSRFILTSMTASVTAKKQRRGKPYVYLRTLKNLHMNVSASYE